MAKFSRIAALLLSLSGSWAQAEPATPPPAPNAVEKYLFSFTSQLSREQRVRLASYLPGIFPIRFVCRFQPSQGEGNVVLPGEWVGAETGGNLSCPGLITADLEKNSRFRVSQEAGLPVLSLELGEMHVKPSAHPFVVGTPAMRIRAVSSGEGLQVILKATPGKQMIGCDGGAMAAALEATPGKDQVKYLFSNVCAFNLEADGLTYNLYSRDIVEYENLRVVRPHWPVVQDEFVTRFAPPNGSRYFFLNYGVQKNAAKRLLTFSLPFHEFFDATCILYQRENETAPPKEIARVPPGQVKSGMIEFDGAGPPMQYAMTCQIPGKLIASNILF